MDGMSLIKTIKVPRILGQINARLPDSQYEPEEVKSEARTNPHTIEPKERPTSGRKRDSRLLKRNQSLPPTPLDLERLKPHVVVPQ